LKQTRRSIKKREILDLKVDFTVYNNYIAIETNVLNKYNIRTNH